MDRVQMLERSSGVVVGRARTMQLGVVRDRDRMANVANRQLAFELCQGAGPGDFLVVGAPTGRRCSIWGGFLTLQASLRGAVGAVVDGLTRDVAEVAELKFPLWCLGVSSLPPSVGGFSCLGVNLPVSCGGVEVMPGDYIVADADGVVVVPVNEVEQILATCEEQMRREVLGQERLKAGDPLVEVYGFIHG
jgi:4-hydroxy-4-methyl-2-oxoglutarate aldolase